MYLHQLGEESVDEPIEIKGRTYWKKSGNPIKPPICDPVATVLTLDAMLSALDAPELDGLEKDGLQIVVQNHAHVSITTAPDCTWAQREIHISARCDVKPFPFGQFLDIEEFIVKAQCRFVDDGAKSAMISHVSSICDEKVITNTDDGISQSVVREDKVGRKGRHEMTPMLALMPHRTFPEIEQPASNFLLRIKDGPRAALFEADGGLWETKAVRSIAAYIREDKRVKAKEIAVIG
jgi:hypothetical protein